MAWTFLRVYFDQEKAWETLSDAERGRLLLAALKYAARGEPPTFSGNERYQWPQIQVQIDKERQAYRNKVAQCSEAGKASADKRWNSERPLTTVNDRQRPLPEEQEQKQEQKQEHPIGEEKKPKEKKATPFEVFARENSPDRESEVALLKALRDFELMRNKIKKPLTDSAVERLLAKLQKSFQQEDWVQVLNQSTDHCWQDLYPLKGPEELKPARGRKQYTTKEEYDSKPSSINTSQLDKIQAIFGGAT